MKRIYLIATFLLIISYTGFSQVNKDAVGIRLGSGLYNSAEISYQKRLSDINRFELNLGYGIINEFIYSELVYYDYDLIKDSQSMSLFSVAYHWSFNIVSGLNWYIGPGVNMGLFSYRGSYANIMPTFHSNINIYNRSLDFDFGIGGQIGLEYDFNHLNVPILVSLDFRPMVQLQPFIKGEDEFHNNWSGALSVRYTF